MRLSGKHTRTWFTTLVVAGLLWFGCDADEGPAPLPDEGFLVVVETSLYEPLQGSLVQYAEMMQPDGIDVYVEPWGPGTVEELRELVFEYVDLHGIEGALLIGELPTAWYEQSAFSHEEEFPMDLYLQDRDAKWLDEDDDGIFDRHSDLDLEIYTARIDGTPTELQQYFSRTRHYRTVGPLADVSAFIFIDNGWSAVVTAHTFQLNELYSRVDIIQDPTDSTRAAYLAKLTGEGAEFVYQWIHSFPRYLSIHDLNEYGQPVLTTIWKDDIARHNLKASFYNLFNCSAARFTEPNLAEAYTVGTNYGLAVIGSTKVGSVSDPRVLHQSLAQGMRWGEAYRKWFNEVGKHNDQWHLGIVIMGDPLLTLSGDLLPWKRAAAAAWEPPPALDEIMETIAAESMLGTFEEYRASHPEFFDD